MTDHVARSACLLRSPLHWWPWSICRLRSATPRTRNPVYHSRPRRPPASRRFVCTSWWTSGRAERLRGLLTAPRCSGTGTTGRFENSTDCDPYEAGKSSIQRRYSADHTSPVGRLSPDVQAQTEGQGHLVGDDDAHRAARRERRVLGARVTGQPKPSCPSCRPRARPAAGRVVRHGASAGARRPDAVCRDRRHVRAASTAAALACCWELLGSVHRGGSRPRSSTRRTRRGGARSSSSSSGCYPLLRGSTSSAATTSSGSAGSPVLFACVQSWRSKRPLRRGCAKSRATPTKKGVKLAFVVTATGGESPAARNALPPAAESLAPP